MNIDVPCNVGEYLYRVDKSRKIIETKKISQICVYIGRNGCVIRIDFEICGFCTPSDFGKTVFKNRADALQKLEEIQ